MNRDKWILVVEDNGPMRRLIRATLEQEGYQVCEAEDGATALQCVNEYSPALMLQDLHLPDMDGVDLIRILRRTGPAMAIPILAFSGLRTKLEEARLIPGGFTDYLFKPVSREELLLKVSESLLRSH